MLIIRTITELKKCIKRAGASTSASPRKRGSSNKTIGFVPTMGYLHDGHISLVRAAKKENDFTVVSIFVNPMQFGPNEDLDKYPRDEKKDIALLKKEKVDILFLPGTKELYPGGFKTTVSVKELSGVLCGASRPVHFDGVCTIVCKLFNLVEPDTAYFGQKDGQQLIIIKKMVEDLNLNVKIKAVPTVREKDGLAMSSRNMYLTKEERAQAPVLYQSLLKAKELINNVGATCQAAPTKIINTMRKMILNGTNGKAKIDYIEIRDAKTLDKIKKINGGALIALAVKVGKARLIDNITIQNNNRGLASQKL